MAYYIEKDDNGEAGPYDDYVKAQQVATNIRASGTECEVVQRDE